MKSIIPMLFAAGAGLFAVPAFAQSYPEQPVNIVFPNRAGSGYHTALLAVLDEMQDALPVAVNVTAMPGAGTSEGNRFVQSQADDGYTLLFIHEALFTSSALGMLNFDPSEEFEAIARVVTTCSGLFAGANAPFGTLDEMVSYAEENPGAVRAAINTGAISHVEILSVGNMTNADLTPVHIGGGTSGFTQATLAGDVDIFSASPGSVAGLVESGDVIPLAYYGENRHSTMPNTPTLAEHGYEGEDVCIGGYFWIRSSAPEEAKAFWENAVEKSITADVESRLEERLNMDIGFVGREELSQIMPEKFTHWTGMMKDAGVGK